MKNIAMLAIRTFAPAYFLLAICIGETCQSIALAQFRFDLKTQPRPIEAEAFVGRPFGVGRISFELPQNMLPEPLGVAGVGLGEKDGRALYPALDDPALGKVMKEILDADTPLSTGGPVREQVGGILRELFVDRPPRATLYFLFRGDGPLALTLEAGEPIRLEVAPRNDPAAHRRLLQRWWQCYAEPAGPLEPKPDYPPVVENYMMSMLARRLNLQLPEAQQTPSAHAELRREAGFHLGTEPLRMAMQQDRILGLNNLDQPADRPLPEAVGAPGPKTSEAAKDATVEPMASRVPPECFYARFGSFANFLWLQDTLDKWGGDAQNLIAMRGLDRELRSRMEQQLVLKQTALSRLLGNTVVADVALIGTDMFFREGASYGLLFQARSNMALSATIVQQRQERLAAGGASQQKLTILGQEVSYLTSPDGAVRSYYVVDGDFHLVTTSKHLVERFLATKESGEGGLGDTEGFRHARTVMPLERNDTIWLYVSDAFFQNLTGPHYRVEMARRLQAAADITLVELARLAAVAEGQPNDSIEPLKKASLLPPEFGPLPDGSRIVLEGNDVSDSLRGRLGAFVPVSDIPVEKVTQAEAADYQQFAEFYRSHWGRMDPIIAAVKRKALADDREHVTVDVLMSPFAPEHFEVLRRWLGPADQQQLATIDGDLAFIELVLADQRIFGGLRDLGRLPTGSMLAWLPGGRLRDFLVGYIGTTGELGLLKVLNLGIPPASDAAGYARSPLDGWRRRYGPFTIFSFQRDVLAEVVPQLRFEPAERPAQVRLRVDDLSQSRIAPAVDRLSYARSRSTSLGNLHFLHVLGEQFHVPPAERKEVAERLLDAKLVCPLGGEYALVDQDRGAPHWTSTALGPDGTMPEGYRSPPMDWFRGLDMDATMTQKTVSAHAEVLMQMPAEK